MVIIMVNIIVNIMVNILIFIILFFATLTIGIVFVSLYLGAVSKLFDWLDKN